MVTLSVMFTLLELVIYLHCFMRSVTDSYRLVESAGLLRVQERTQARRLELLPSHFKQTFCLKVPFSNICTGLLGLLILEDPRIHKRVSLVSLDEVSNHYSRCIIILVKPGHQEFETMYSSRRRPKTILRLTTRRGD